MKMSLSLYYIIKEILHKIEKYRISERLDNDFSHRMILINQIFIKLQYFKPTTNELVLFHSLPQNLFSF